MILQGDALEELRKLPDKCCSVCVTSPPYYNARDYGAADQLGTESSPEEYIRKLVEEGRMEEAEEMLGMPYTLVGAVEHGNHIGHTLGFPTVNLLPPAGKLLPPNGVYYAAVRHNGKVYKAISNVGTKPTVSSEKVMGVESYLYDFDQDIYGQEIEVALKRFRRPERRFGSLEELKEQLDRDIADGRNA